MGPNYRIPRSPKFPNVLGIQFPGDPFPMEYHIAPGTGMHLGLYLARTIRDAPRNPHGLKIRDALGIPYNSGIRDELGTRLGETIRIICLLHKF